MNVRVAIKQLVPRPRTGMIHQSPLLNIIAVTTDRVTRGLREFGLTPASRSRISVSPDSSMDSLEAKLCKMKRRG